MNKTDLYTEGLDMYQFEHVPQISSYNRNYYIGFGKDLLYEESDDDCSSQWTLVHHGVIGYTNEWDNKLRK